MKNDVDEKFKFTANVKRLSILNQASSCLLMLTSHWIYILRDGTCEAKRIIDLKHVVESSVN